MVCSAVSLSGIMMLPVGEAIGLEMDLYRNLFCMYKERKIKGI